MSPEILVQLGRAGGVEFRVAGDVLVESAYNNDPLFLLMGYVREGDLITIKAPSGTTIKVRVEESLTFPEGQRPFQVDNRS